MRPIIPLALVAIVLVALHSPPAQAEPCPPGQQLQSVRVPTSCSVASQLTEAMISATCKTTVQQCRRVTTQADREAAMTARAVRWATCAVQILGRPSPADSGNRRPQTNARRAAATASGASNGTR